MHVADLKEQILFLQAENLKLKVLLGESSISDEVKEIFYKLIKLTHPDSCSDYNLVTYAAPLTKAYNKSDLKELLSLEYEIIQNRMPEGARRYILAKLADANLALKAAYKNIKIAA